MDKKENDVIISTPPSGVPLMLSNKGTKASTFRMDSNGQQIFDNMDGLDPISMLKTKRGYQIKRLENIQAGYTKQVCKSY